MSLPIVEASNPRIPRKKGQPAKSKKHSDLYTDEDPKGTIHGLGFKDVATAKKSVSKIRGSSRSHAHKIQAAIAMEQRARVMGKTAEAAIYRSFINSMKKKTKKMNEEKVEEGWSDKYKKSIDCNNPKGFSQKAHCQGKKKKMNEDKQIKKIVKQLRKSVKSHAKQADTLEKKITEGSLHKWFKGSKSKDGKGGWVNVVTGGTCASDEPGEGTPKCVSSAKRASMSKAERLSAARRKKKADPGQQSKTGAAKPTYVSTDKPKKKMKEELKHISVPLKTIKSRSDFLKKYQGDPGLKYNTDKAHYEPEGESINEADKKGKGSGTKDACYHKVKSRYSVWPSAYASGALVKCRKVGAANWGNSKKEEFEGNISYNTFMEKCWKGYEKKGMKTMFGKRYPNCVKKEETQLEDSRLTSSNDMQSKMYADKNKSGKKMSDDEIKKEKGGKEFLARLKAAKEKMKKEGTSYGIYKGDGKPKGAMAKFGEKKKKEKKIEEKVNLKDKSSQYARSTKEVDTAMTDHVNRTRGKNYNLKTGKVTDVGRYRRPSKREARNELISLNKESKSYSQFQQECWKTHKKVGMKMKGGKLVNDCRPKNEEAGIDEAAAWTRKAGKNKSGGLNEKGRKSYERENPGSDLKAPSKKVGNPRRASFCARMKGMKKKLTSSKTANDPDSRINKSLRKWNC